MPLIGLLCVGLAIVAWVLTIAVQLYVVRRDGKGINLAGFFAVRGAAIILAILLVMVGAFVAVMVWILR
jgi:hypothetical protein